MTDLLPEGVTIAEIVEVLETAEAALFDEGYSHTGGQVDRLLARLKETPHD